MTIYERALEEIRQDNAVGLGSGRASTEFIKCLGKRVGAGLRVRGVPTSKASEQLARQLNIPLVPLHDAMPLDVTVDGADEVDAELNLIKGYGRALVREKIVAAASSRLIILVGADKLVPGLGARGKLPVEVVPFAVPLCKHRLERLGCRPMLHEVDGAPFVTDNGNYILDCAIETIPSPLEFERACLAIPGVVGTGLFLDMAHTVLVGDDAFELKEVRQRRAS